MRRRRSKLFSGQVIPLFREEILREYGEMIVSTPTGEILPDMKDLPFYEVVLEKGEDEAYLVTGNLKHFPQKSFIVAAREFLSILDSKSE